MTLEEAQESLAESVNKFEEATREVTELESQIEACTERIEELQKLADNGTISVIEQEELDRLKETNAELDRNLRIEQERARLSAIEGAKTADEILTKTVESKYVDDTIYDGVGGSYEIDANILPQQELDAAISEYQRLQNEIDNLNKSFDNGDISLKDYEKQLGNLTDQQINARTRASEMNEILSECEQAYSNLNGTGENLTTTQANNYNGVVEANKKYTDFLGTINSVNHAFEKLDTTEKSQDLNKRTDLFSSIVSSKESIDTFTSSVESAYDAYSKLMNPNASSSDMLSSIMSITEAVSSMDGSLNWEFIGRYSNSVELLGDVIEQISERYAKSMLSGAGIDVDSAFGKMLANNIIQAKRASIQLDNLNTQIDSLQSAYDSLTDIVETYNTTGYITLDQLQVLLELEPQYLSCLIDENGQLQLNNEAMALLANQRLNDAEAQAVQQAITELGQIALQDEKTAVEENAQAFSDAITDLSSYNTELANTIAETSVAAATIRDLNAAINGAESEGAKDDQINTVLGNLDTKLKLINSARNKVSSGEAKKVVSTSSTSSTSAKNDFKETFDWVETAISRVQRTITNLGKIVSATYRNWSTRNNALSQEMSAVNQAIALQQSAYSAYMNKANSVNLPEYYKNLVRNGGLHVEDITNEALAENIKLYQEYYEKALDASDAIEDLRANLAELAMTNFDNISKQYDEQIALIDHYTSMLEGYINQSEAAGFWASEVYYQKLAEKELENISQLQSQYNALIAAFNENVNNGSIEKYSEDWYAMYEAINQVEQALQNANTSLVEFNQTLQQIRWDLFDRSINYKNDLAEEADFLIDLLDNYELYNKNGSLTEHGLAVQGLHAMNYNVYMEESIALGKELQKVNEEIAKDPNDLTLIDRRNELLGLQQEAIQNAMAEKEAIKDLLSEGYNQMLDSLQELIDKRKEALNAERDLYEYQNTIKEKTDTISNYKKQLQAYAGDNSEEAKATIQKLQVDLAKAEKDLQETEYEKWLNDQEALLDDLYDQTEEWINGRLDQIDGLVYDAIVATNNNASIISGTLKDVTSSLGLSLSTNMEAIWRAENGTTNVVKSYGDMLYGTQTAINYAINNGATNTQAAINGGITNIQSSINSSTTTIQNALKTIDNDILKMIAALNAEAKAKAESIAKQQEQAAASQSSSSNNNNNYTPPASYQEPASNKVTLNGGLFYEDSYKGGHTGNNSSQWTGHEVEITATSKTGMVHIVDKTTGTILGWVDPKQLNGYATGTINAKKGFNLIAEAGDEIVLDNHGNAMLASGAQLYPFEGGETVFNAAKTAELLRNNLVPLNEQTLLSGMIKKANYRSLQGLNRTSGHVSNDIKMNITLPNVTDYNSFVTQLKSDKRFEKIVQSMTIDQVLNKNSLSKNKL